MSWRYQTEDEDERHFGPVAEDFQAYLTDFFEAGRRRPASLFPPAPGGDAASRKSSSNLA